MSPDRPGSRKRRSAVVVMMASSSSAAARRERERRIQLFNGIRFPDNTRPSAIEWRCPEGEWCCGAVCCGEEQDEPTDPFPWLVGFLFFLLVCVNVVFFISYMYRRKQQRDRSHVSSVAFRPPSTNIRLQERSAQPTDPFHSRPQSNVQDPVTTTSFPPFKPVDRRPPTATCGTQTSSMPAEGVQLAPPSYLQAVLSEDAAVAQQTSPPPYSSSSD
ncbi:hypothetical protein M3Y99_01671400 [Aphelenchoides fujianensis]|nr:hypothetical protein M3Y99_01671400 [Aphelenchoides fujianensis]